MAANHTIDHAVMNTIQNLINPVPSSLDFINLARPDYRYQFYLRTQPRGFNHDACDSCEENGDLVCCNACPAAFHLECTAPPLTTELIEKLSTWSCNACTYKKLDQEPGSSKSMIKTEPEKSGLKSVFAQLANDAKKNNPKEFKLPSSFGCIEAPLPGTSRLVFKKSCPSRSKQTIIEMDNFLVPIPAAVCHFCTKSCRLGALIKCDLCPKFYHLDCLTPPLTVPPTTIWQCPLHPEPALESQLKSNLLSERVRIFDYTSEAIYGYDIQREFMRKAKRNIPRPYTRKVPTYYPVDQIPKAVAETYKCMTAAAFPANGIPDAALESDGFATPFGASAQTMEDNRTDDNDMDWMPTEMYREKQTLQKDKTQSADEKLNQLLVLAKAASSLEKIEVGAKESEFDARKMVNKLDLATIKMLAAKQLESIRAKRISEGKSGSVLFREKENSSMRSGTPPTKLMLLCLNNGKGYKFGKTLIEIGLGSQVDINLVESHCKNISKKHAAIFHDSITNKWELLCYSTYGIKVNRCLYGCSPQDGGDGSDIEDKAKKLFAEAVGARKAELLQKARSSATSNLKSSMKISSAKDCECPRSGVWSGPCSEQSVEIKQHDQIEIGCLKFVVLSAVLNEVNY